MIIVVVIIIVIITLIIIITITAGCEIRLRRTVALLYWYYINTVILFYQTLCTSIFHSRVHFMCVLKNFMETDKWLRYTI